MPIARKRHRSDTRTTVTNFRNYLKQKPNGKKILLVADDVRKKRTCRLRTERPQGRKIDELIGLLAETRVFTIPRTTYGHSAFAFGRNARWAQQVLIVLTIYPARFGDELLFNRYNTGGPRIQPPE